MKEIELVIKIDEETYNELMSEKDFIHKVNNPYKIAIVDGTPIPENATNGDMIKAMFPHKGIHFGFNDEYGKVWILSSYSSKKVCTFDLDWWNAPYKGVEEWN